MRLASLSVLAFAFACGSSPDAPNGAGGAGGSSAGTGGSSSQPLGGSATSSGGTSTSGGTASAGASAGGKPAGGSTSVGGTSSGGASAGSGGSGNTSGSAGAASGGGGSGGNGTCTKNLDCKLDPPASTGDLQQDCVNRINQFLTQCACLPALKRRTDAEACANQMAKYDADHNSAHAGIIAGICQPGGSQNSCPGYASNEQVVGLCMQQMWDEGPPPTPNCTGDCYQEHGHFINMTDSEVTQVACGFYTTSSGKVWAVQNFSR